MNQRAAQKAAFFLLPEIEFLLDQMLFSGCRQNRCDISLNISYIAPIKPLLPPHRHLGNLSILRNSIQFIRDCVNFTKLFTLNYSPISTAVESAETASESALGYGVWQE